MILQHFHCCNILGVDIIGSYAVASLQQVHVFNIELLNALAVKLYPSTF